MQHGWREVASRVEGGCTERERVSRQLLVVRTPGYGLRICEPNIHAEISRTSDRQRNMASLFQSRHSSESLAQSFGCAINLQNDSSCWDAYCDLSQQGEIREARASQLTVRIPAPVRCYARRTAAEVIERSVGGFSVQSAADILRANRNSRSFKRCCSIRATGTTNVASTPSIASVTTSSRSVNPRSFMAPALARRAPAARAPKFVHRSHRPVLR